MFSETCAGRHPWIYQKQFRSAAPLDRLREDNEVPYNGPGKCFPDGADSYEEIFRQAGAERFAECENEASRGANPRAVCS